VNFIKKYSLLVLFAALMLIIFAADAISPLKEFSELENRYLEKRPKFSVDMLIQNKYTVKYEEFTNDQFIGRDFWIDLKSRSEAVLGKIENNGIVYGKDNYLFEKYSFADNEKIEKNLSYVNKFIGKHSDLNISFAVIPNSYEILNEKLPVGLSNVNQTEYINKMYSKLKNSSVKLVNFTDILSSNDDKYIYYRTDHHWTTFGAYLAYCEYVKLLNLTPVDIAALNPEKVEGFYGSYYSKAKKYNAVADTINYYDVPYNSVEIDLKPADGIYDFSAFGKRDKYAGFLRGNNGITVIKGSNSHASKKLLVVKDSYANSFVPFLMYNFDEVYVIDLRSYTGSFNSLVNEISFDDILIMYNFMNFANDSNIYKITE